MVKQYCQQSDIQVEQNHFLALDPNRSIRSYYNYRDHLIGVFHYDI